VPGIALGEDHRTTLDPPPGGISAELLDDLCRKLPENVVSAEKLEWSRNRRGGPVLAWADGRIFHAQLLTYSIERTRVFVIKASHGA
jgi:hypothetical protein